MEARKERRGSYISLFYTIHSVVRPRVIVNHTRLGKYPKRLAEHPVAMLVLAQNHEFVLSPWMEIIHRCLRNFSREDLHGPPLRRVRGSVPARKLHVSFSHKISIKR